jgi:ketosteroid isomerase-like protein
MSLATTPRRCAGPSSHLSSTSLPSLSRRSRVTCAATSAPPSRPTAKDVALAYYTNYNNKNIPGVLELIADDCVYEDLVYQEPFRGKREVAAYFERLGAMLPPDIKFVVEDITEGDPMRVGVRWYVVCHYAVGILCALWWRYTLAKYCRVVQLMCRLSSCLCFNI